MSKPINDKDAVARILEGLAARESESSVDLDQAIEELARSSALDAEDVHTARELALAVWCVHQDAQREAKEHAWGNLKPARTFAQGLHHMAADVKRGILGAFTPIEEG